MFFSVNVFFCVLCICIRMGRLHRHEPEAACSNEDERITGLRVCFFDSSVCRQARACKRRRGVGVKLLKFYEVLVAWDKDQLRVAAVLVHAKAPWRVADVLFAHPAPWACALTYPWVYEDPVAP